MASVLLLHSVRGLRDLERAAAGRLRAAGHVVATPDLFDGVVPATLEDGLALEEELWPEPLIGRAKAAAEALPAQAVLAGFSMGAALAAQIWTDRPETAGLLLLHGIGEAPAGARPGTPVEIHLAEPDPFVPEDWIAQCQDAASRAGTAPQTFRYPGAGHLFTDSTLDDHDPQAAALLWQRADAFLARL